MGNLLGMTRRARELWATCQPTPCHGMPWQAGKVGPPPGLGEAGSKDPQGPQFFLAARGWRDLGGGGSLMDAPSCSCGHRD